MRAKSLGQEEMAVDADEGGSGKGNATQGVLQWAQPKSG